MIDMIVIIEKKIDFFSLKIQKKIFIFRKLGLFVEILIIVYSLISLESLNLFFQNIIHSASILVKNALAFAE